MLSQMACPLSAPLLPQLAQPMSAQTTLFLTANPAQPPITLRLLVIGVFFGLSLLAHAQQPGAHSKNQVASAPSKVASFSYSTRRGFVQRLSAGHARVYQSEQRRGWGNSVVYSPQPAAPLISRRPQLGPAADRSDPDQDSPLRSAADAGGSDHSPGNRH